MLNERWCENNYPGLIWLPGPGSNKVVFALRRQPVAGEYNFLASQEVMLVSQTDLTDVTLVSDIT